MNPREKAIELLNRFSATMYGDSQWLMIPSKSMQEDVKQCALIAVEEIINSHPQKPQFKTIIDTHGIKEFIHDYPTDLFWQDFKQEIEKL